MALIVGRPKRSRTRLKCDGARAETRFRLSAKRTSPFKSAGASVQSTTGSRGVRISGINAGYTMFRRRVKSTGYPLHPPVSPSLPLLYVTVCHHISTGLYFWLPSCQQWMSLYCKTQLKFCFHVINPVKCSYRFTQKHAVNAQRGREIRV